VTADSRLLAALAVLVLLLTALSLASGSTDLPLAVALGDLWSGVASPDALILREIRLPRTAIAAGVGASLGLAGAALQGLLRNPLAEPGIVGASNCAALGAVCVLYFGLAAGHWLLVPVGAVAGAGASVLLLALLAGRRASALSLILAGVAISALAGALIALALNFAPSPYAMHEIVFWLMGSVANRSLPELAFSLPLMAAGWLLLLGSGRHFDALSLGEDVARSMGFGGVTMLWRALSGVALCVGGAVAVSGSIAFVGLVVPHVLRPLVGHRPSRLLLPSALGGAALVLLADLLVQALSGGTELKLGVLTALVGAPFFLHLVLTLRGRLA
jgi:iron complex transport system permease protein